MGCQVRLQRSFFERPTLDVARDLLGQRLVFQNQSGFISETEAYFGFNDPASHAARGKTPRNAVMFGPAGVSYIYFIYGMYFCLNIVTEAQGFPAAVLIRGLLLPDGRHLDGPGKLCRELGLSKEWSGIDMTTHSDFFVEKTKKRFHYETTPRIGIKQGTDLLWRFCAVKPAI